ncbi:unnamed protein product (macronuclear) [Paramecium tetraurelia]|uniref:Uncharacterized protein n=1 Tax=Paramecium tetraurelia TaxID=5888 RepID=A0DMA0_PARTE|nr:uncharacterized protein GSPATT00018385001 [Paramecium tetraurelia]CAK84167.1 unnamed protein product [Paramecium tetraurelia]|eukprot:XP_001451564.1 hypothetical protein (macronuclear) [Paramecium tetraurelia strain d4-2]
MQLILLSSNSKVEMKRIQYKYKNNYANIPYSQFQERLAELKEKRMIKQQQQQLEQSNSQQQQLEQSNGQELEIPFSKEQQQQPDKQKKIEYVEQHNDEDDQPELKLESQQTLINNYQQRRNIQFLRFQEIMPEIFEID